MRIRIRNWIWPSLIDVHAARRTALQGTWAAVLIALMAALVPMISPFRATPLPMDPWAYVDALQFAAIAFAIYKMSRVASILGLAIYLIQRIVIWVTVGPENIILAPVITLAFVNSARGTFVYHRFAKISK